MWCPLPIPFNNMPNKAWKSKNRKIYISWPQTDISGKRMPTNQQQSPQRTNNSISRVLYSIILYALDLVWFSPCSHVSCIYNSKYILVISTCKLQSYLDKKWQWFSLLQKKLKTNKKHAKHYSNNTMWLSRESTWNKRPLIVWIVLISDRSNQDLLERPPAIIIIT